MFSFSTGMKNICDIIKSISDYIYYMSKPKNHCQLNTRKLFHDNGIMTFKNPTVCTRRRNYNMVNILSTVR